MFWTTCASAASMTSRGWSVISAVNPDTETIVRAVDYHVVGAPEQFRVYSDDVGDIARRMRVDVSAAAGEESV